jgi:SAM-dependent methyltransferase
VPDDTANDHGHGRSRGHSHEEWEDRYSAAEQMWSGRPNDVLVVEVSDLPPGRALDVGCGEGADAIWLAARGWRVTGVDVSQIALDRAVGAAGEAGVAVEWVRSDVTVEPPAAGAYDLVSVHYPALPKSPGGSVVDGLLAAVAPEGTLLVVGHARSTRSASVLTASTPPTSSNPVTSRRTSTTVGRSRPTRSGRGSPRRPQARRSPTTTSSAPAGPGRPDGA